MQSRCSGCSFCAAPAPTPPGEYDSSHCYSPRQCIPGGRPSSGSGRGVAGTVRFGMLFAQTVHPESLQRLLLLCSPSSDTTRRVRLVALLFTEAVHPESLQRLFILPQGSPGGGTSGGGPARLRSNVLRCPPL